jgi:nitrous oxidase accessory protein NosD
MFRQPCAGFFYFAQEQGTATAASDDKFPESAGAFMRFLLFIVLAGNVLLCAAQPESASLPLPLHIGSGDTIKLKCGRTYRGELDLEQAYRVTVQTEGNCGPATITPAQAVNGWVRSKQQPGIWSAPIGFVPVQLQIGEQFIELAHYPNRPQIWARGSSRLPGQLRVFLPASDLAGATLVWRAADWLIQTGTVLRYEDAVLTLAEANDEEFGLPAETEFYLEGKRWMLDAPGEWAVENGRIVVWTPDGKSPQGRAWAAPRARAINASGSRGVKIKNVRIEAATLGIDGSDATDLQIADTTIINSGEEAILAGGSGLRVTRVTILNSGQHGIRANDNARDVVIADSIISGVGMLGMPRRSKGAIVFEQASGQRILRNRITDSSYIAIRVFRDAEVSDNLIERACLILTDCGGIYTFARDRQPLRVRIMRNQIRHLRGRMAHAIYLDDHANGVTVSENQIADNPGGMQLHNGFDNLIRRNLFMNSGHEHILFNETGPSAAVLKNRISNNRFISNANTPIYRLWSEHGGAHVRQFATFSGNTYVGAPHDFAEVAGSGMLSYPNWQRHISDETDATLMPR